MEADGRRARARRQAKAGPRSPARVVDFRKHVAYTLPLNLYQKKIERKKKNTRRLLGEAIER